MRLGFKGLGFKGLGFKGLGFKVDPHLIVWAKWRAALLDLLALTKEVKVNPMTIWGTVKIMVPFWVPIIIRGLIRGLI